MAWAQKSNRRRERVFSQSHFQLPDLGESQRPAETLAQLRGGKGLLFAVTSLLTHMQVCSVNFEITLFLRTYLRYIQVSQDGFKSPIFQHTSHPGSGKTLLNQMQSGWTPLVTQDYQVVKRFLCRKLRGV